MLMMIPISIWTLSGCGNSDPVDWIDKNCGVLSDPRSQTAPLVSCGQKGPFRHEGGPLGGHCMVSRIPGFVGATQEWCRTFTQKHPNAIAYVFGKLIDWNGYGSSHCQIIFEGSKPRASAHKHASWHPENFAKTSDLESDLRKFC